MYVSGNDSLISAVLGSTDFYDMLSRVEMVSNIAAHDEELVDTLLDEITTLDNTKSALETEKLTLEMNKSTYEQKKEEMKADMTELSDEMQSSQEEMDRIALEADILNKDKSALESENSSLDDLYEEIQAQIKKDNETKAAAAKAETTTQAATSASTTDAAQKVQEATKAQTTEAATEAQTEAATEAPTDAPTEAPTEAPVVEEETEAPAAAETEPTYVDTSTSVSGFAWPAPASYYISSGFGSRWGTTHRGIDIAGGVEGTSAVASKSGTVISVNNSCVHNYAKSSNCCGNGYGNYVIISHDDGTQTLYGHLASANVSVGEYVSQGQVVGTIGSTGYSTGFHLHFEIYVDGVAVDPQNYVP
jgi:murein DD-endopeptidase MepM/ murein hydrolase activator NlpD